MNGKRRGSAAPVVVVVVETNEKCKSHCPILYVWYGSFVYMAKKNMKRKKTKILCTANIEYIEEEVEKNRCFISCDLIYISISVCSTFFFAPYIFICEWVYSLSHCVWMIVFLVTSFDEIRMFILLDFGPLFDREKRESKILDIYYTTFFSFLDLYNFE